MTQPSLSLRPPAGRTGPPALARRLLRDLVLVLGLGLAFVLLRSAAAGALPGAAELPPPGAPERSVLPADPPVAVPPVPESVDEILAPVRALVGSERDGGAPLTSSPDGPRPTPAPPTAPSTGGDVSRPSSPPSPSHPDPVDLSSGAPGEPAEKPAPEPIVRNLVEPILRPLVPLVATVLAPLPPVLEGVASLVAPPVLTERVAEVAPTVLAAPVRGTVGGLVEPSSTAAAPVLLLPTPEAASLPAMTSPPSVMPSGDVARPVPERKIVTSEVASAPAGDAEPVKPAPAPTDPSPGRHGTPSPSPSAEPGARQAAVLPPIETPAVVAAGLVSPSSLDGRSATSPRPGYSPD